MDCNQISVCGKISKLDNLRYTPTGIAVIGLAIDHRSQQLEAQVTRQVICNIPAVVVGSLALKIAELKIGNHVRLTGFINQRSHTNRQLVLHVNHFVLI